MVSDIELLPAKAEPMGRATPVRTPNRGPDAGRSYDCGVGGDCSSARAVVGSANASAKAVHAEASATAGVKDERALTGEAR
jgi:hypothetical protein